MTDSIPAHVQYVGAALFAVAVIHTFSTKFFEGLAHRQPAHAGLWHLLGEVEVVFGFWAMVLMVFLFAALGRHDALAYIDSRTSPSRCSCSPSWSSQAPGPSSRRRATGSTVWLAPFPCRAR